MAQKQGRNAYRRELVAEFDALFPPSLFRKLPRHGNEDWTPRKVVWVSVIMFWVSGKTLDEQFSTARRIVNFLRPHWNVPVSYSGFVAAQVRWWPLVGPLLIARLRPDEESAGAAWRVRCWLVLAVDGSRFECPRTTSNERGLGRACRRARRTVCRSRQDLAANLSDAVAARRHGAALGLPPRTGHRQRTTAGIAGWNSPNDFQWPQYAPPRNAIGTNRPWRLDDMLADLPEHTLLTADAGFISYDLCSQLIDAGQRLVLRIGGNKTLIENLEEDESRGESQDEDIVFWWPQNSQSRPPLKLRRICFPSSGGWPVVLITNVLEAEVLSDEDAREIYQSRWGIEVYFRHLKQTMGFTTIHSRTPATALNEQSWKLISFWVLQRITVTHQVAARKNPRRFSAAQARREIRDVLQLMQQGKRGKSITQRCLTAQIDTYVRHGPKETRDWPRKKNDKPPQPPKTRPAKANEIQRAKQLGFKFLLIS